MFIWSNSTRKNGKCVAPPKKSYLIRCASDCLEVEFMPLACDSILHCSIVQVVTSDVCSTIISRSLPAQHHVVLDPLQQGHSGGRAWDGCRRIRLSLAQQQPLTVLHLLPQQRINAHSLLERAHDLCIFIVGHPHIKIWWPLKFSCCVLLLQNHITLYTHSAFYFLWTMQS